LATASSSDTDIEMALNVIEALQVAELDNYFQDACTTFEAKGIDKLDSEAAIIYTVILPERLEIISSRYTGRTRNHNRATTAIYYRTRSHERSTATFGSNLYLVD
jgi:CHAT domain-containing protein